MVYKDHFYRRTAAVLLLSLLAAGLGGCIHLHEIPPRYLQPLAWGGLSAPPAPESPAFWPAAWLSSLALALAYAGARLLRARRAALTRLQRGQDLDREDLALARTARDALQPLLRKQLGRWRVMVLEELRQRGEEP